MKRLRIAVGQISSESNHFVSTRCEIEFFRATGYLHQGDELFPLIDSETEVGGVLQACRKAGDVEVIPLLATRGNSSGVLSDRCWSYLKERMLKRLKAAGQIDGILMSHHGSMAVESEDDPEGDLAVEIREILGADVPFAMTLDLHGNLTRRMVEATNIICGYNTYPHRDVRQTGRRATELLLRTVRREIRPVMAQAKLPLLVPVFNAFTHGDGPFAKLMREAKNIERRPCVLSTSLFCVGSYIDVPDVGCSALVITDGDPKRASVQSQRLANKFWSRRKQFVIKTVSAKRALVFGRKIKKGPVLLLDTADTTGGGAAGDSIALLSELIAGGVTEPCLAMVVDAEAARRCHETVLGREITLKIGHRLDPQWGKPIVVTGKVCCKLGGRFRYGGGIFGGTWASMGPSAVLQIGSIRLLVMTNPTYDYAYEQYEAAGLDPRQAKFVCVKNMMNFRFGYRRIMKGFFVVNCPGPTPTDMRALPFKRVPRPIFPLNAIRRPRIVMSKSKMQP